MRNSLRIWQAIGVGLWFMAALACILGAVYLPRTLSDHHGTLGYVAAGGRFGDRAAHRIAAFNPESPLPAAGIVVDDLIVDPPRGTPLQGERITLQVVHDGVPRTLEVRAARETSSPTQNFVLFLEGALGLLTFVLGTLLILRRWNDAAALALGSVLLLGTTGLTPMQLPIGPLAIGYIIWIAAAVALALILLAWAALLMSPDTSVRRRRITRGCYAVTVAWLVWSCIAAWYYTGHALPSATLIVANGRTVLQGLALVMCVIAFMDAWRAVVADQRERLRWLFVGLACTLISLALTVGGLAMPIAHPSYMIVTLVSDALVAAACVILTYAILGQRVLDVGFAINRAIVYAVLTGILLMGFGIVEWLVDHVLEFEQRKQSVLLDALLALGIFLVFHRLQHWISHTVEHLFFRSWHVRGEALDRFLETSEHFTDPEALAKASLAALDAYTGTTGSALYGRDSQGRFVLMQSTLAGAAPTVGANDTIVVRLNASHGKPLHQDENWFFPLARRGKLAGFLRLGGKQSRDVYRRDQVERVSQAVRQIGFDLYALRLEQQPRRRVEAPVPSEHHIVRS